MTTPDHAWHADPFEVDRTLEGELPPAERARRLAAAEADPALGQRLAARQRFLAGLAASGAAWRAERAANMPPALEGRVRAALATGSTSSARVLRWAVAAAAVLLIGLGAAVFVDDDRSRAIAMPPAVIHASEAALAPDPGPRGCRDDDALSPLRFPPVRDGALRVWGCSEQNGSTVAKLYRPEELPSVGYAAVAAPNVAPGPTVGRTDLGHTVVFDITYGRKAHYLAVRKAWLERQRRLTPGRESCRACHHLSRVGKANPHNIVERSWRLGG